MRLAWKAGESRRRSESTNRSGTQSDGDRALYVIIAIIIYRSTLNAFDHNTIHYFLYEALER